MGILGNEVGSRECKPEKLPGLYQPEKQQGPSRDCIRVSHAVLRGQEGDLPKWTKSPGCNWCEGNRSGEQEALEGTQLRGLS